MGYLWFNADVLQRGVSREEVLLGEGSWRRRRMHRLDEVENEGRWKRKWKKDCTEIYGRKVPT
jgi:hypothetical protein